jgi:hypothetical protein
MDRRIKRLVVELSLDQRGSKLITRGQLVTLADRRRVEYATRLHLVCSERRARDTQCFWMASARRFWNGHGDVGVTCG